MPSQHTFLCRCSNRAKAALQALGTLGHGQHHEDSRHVHINLEGQDDGFEVCAQRG